MYDGVMRMCEVATDPLFDLKQMSFKEGFKCLGEAVATVPVCPECENCADKANCMACPLFHFIETGSYEKVADYVCQYVRSNVKLFE
jgi:hypothetical protein